MRRAVLLDRDGTIVQETHYLSRLQDLRWFSWTADAVRLLNRAGFVVCVTTNQGGIGLGLYPQAFVDEVHREMAATLERRGARVDGWFYCPHHPAAVLEEFRLDCECRKPRAGMARQAAAKFDLDLSASFVIGDKESDLGLAATIGARGILVRTGYGDDVVRAHNGQVPQASFVAADLMEATSWVLSQSGHPGPL